MNKSEKKMWEIVVPVEMNGLKVDVSYHHKWDEKVRKISGGLTIMKSAIGQWVSPTKHIHVEKVIPVKIACSDADIEKIARMTLTHYGQEEVLYYKISDEVHFVK